MDPSVFLNKTISVLPLKEALPIFGREVPMLLLYAVAMAIYGIFVYNFYTQLAQRDIFIFDISEYKSRRQHAVIREAFGFVLYILKYAILFPLFSFFWFTMLSLFLLVLSKTQSVQTILLIAISLVSATRMLAYYNEDVSKDVAKLIPFTLLGVFLVDPKFFSFNTLFEHFSELPGMLHLALAYLLFVIILELVLRLGFEIKEILFSGEIKEEEEE